MIAFTLSARSWEYAGLIAGLLTLTGVWLQWRSQWHVADVEDDVKDGKLSEDDAQQRIRFIQRRAAALIFGGLGLLVFVTFVLTM